MRTDFCEEFADAVKQDTETAAAMQMVFDTVRSFPLNDAERTKLFHDLAKLLHTARKNMYIAGGLAATHVFMDE